MDDRAWCATAARLLDAPGPPDAALEALVRWLDLTLDADVVSVRHVTFARAVLATGRALVTRQDLPDEGIVATIAAGERFVADPSDDTHADYERAATSSYPFGPGDGCFSLPGDEPHGTPCTGCRTSSGTLVEMAYPLGADVVMAAIRAEVGPWLASDPAG